MLGSKEKKKKAIHGMENLFQGTKSNDAAKKEKRVTGNNMLLQGEMAKREKQAFLEGYRYDIKVLEDGLVKDRV